MKIAIIGPGAIGSTFAFQLSRAGLSVTVVARRTRLELLLTERAIVDVAGLRAPVDVVAELDPAIPYDLVLVTVLATQVEVLLPVLRASAARKVMFMFNTFESITPLRDAVGAHRFAFGFPGGVFALLEAGRIAPQIRHGTTVSDAACARLFSQCGIPTVVEADMQSWLRSHAAMVYPLMAVGVLSLERKAGVSWREAALHVEALLSGLRIVEALGNVLRPSVLAVSAQLPRVVLTALLWALSRTKMSRDLGRLGRTEPRMLAAMMTDACPAESAPLLAVRP